MEETKPVFFDKIYTWFNKDPKSAFITILIIALGYMFFENGSIQQKRIDDKDKFKDEVIAEVRRAYDPKFKEISDTVLSRSADIGTSLNNVDNFIDEQRRKLNKRK